MFPGPLSDDHSSGSSLPAGGDALALLDLGKRPPGGESPSETTQVPGAEELAAMLPGYQILRPLGRGGMGAVYEALQRDLGRKVAIKVLSPAISDIPCLVARFRHEARLMADLRHPGIVRVHEAGETAEGQLYYVMELVEGEDLASRISRAPLNVEESVGIVAAVSDALQAAHGKGVIHRDIKPGNIFLPANGSPLLGDFGLAISAGNDADLPRLTRAGSTVGTVEYAAPEQLARGGPAVTPASDVFSLGVLTYELFTGELPRGNFEPPSQKNPEVDVSFDSVILRALQSDPARRFASAGEFRAALLHAADRQHQQERRASEARAKLRRRTCAAVTATSLFLITLGLAALAWVQSLRATANERLANERKASAEEARNETDGLIRFLLRDLRHELEPTGNLAAMDSVLEKAVEHFRKVDDASGNSPQTALKLADIIVVKADVIGVRGMNEKADALYSEALALAQKARASAPENVAWNRRVAQALLDRSEHRMASSRFGDALSDARLLLIENESLARMDPGPTSTHGLAVAHRAIANALGYTGEPDEAREEYLQSASSFAALVKAEPENPAYAYELASLEMSLGSNAEARGDFDAMLRHFSSWNDFVTAKEGPDSNAYSYSAFRMGVAHLKLQQADQALPFLTDAVRIAERDAAKLPGHKGSLNHVSWCVRLLAECHEALGHADEAATLRQRETEVNALLSQNPEK